MNSEELENSPLWIFESPPQYLAFFYREHGVEAFHELMAELIAAKASRACDLAHDCLTLAETGLIELALIVDSYVDQAPEKLECPRWFPCHNFGEGWCCGRQCAPAAPWNRRLKRQPRKDHDNPLVQDAVRVIAQMRLRDRAGGRADKISPEFAAQLEQVLSADPAN
jgi:hypothetical protein